MTSPPRHFPIFWWATISRRALSLPLFKIRFNEHRDEKTTRFEVGQAKWISGMSGNIPTVRTRLQGRVPSARFTHPFTITMSDSDGDFSDELLELAGAGDAPEKKRKKRQGSSGKSTKRRKPE